MISIDEAWVHVRRSLSAARLLHTEGTAEKARRLAPLFKVSPAKAELAAVLHDIAREYEPAKLLRAARKHGIMVRTVDEANPVLLHGKVGALEAARIGVGDEEVLLAIASHVGGRSGWTGLEKTLYLADKAEPTRDYPGVLEVRSLIERGCVMKALRMAIAKAICHASTQFGFVDPETVVVLNEISQTFEQ